MHTAKRIRVVASVAAFMLLLFVMYRSNAAINDRHHARGNRVAKMNSILDSMNNEKQDELINHEIGKLAGADAGAADVDDQAVLDISAGGSGAKSASVASAEAEAEYDPAQDFLNIRMLSPMVVFSKSYCPYSKRIKKLLKDNYEFAPEYVVVELDQHEHGRELQTYLKEVTGRGTVPNVLVGQQSESRGGCDDFVSMHEDGTLLKVLNAWGSPSLVAMKKDTPSNF
ncbi:hypothetical protein DIURU_001562 [Diutina rugosa]|uniref:Glutaredoxin domain-containing protein n=1 Tax=Diutina rugosa TaxID=5481 RepID=A0A642UTA4_DIURU|nr:uncharacterized protein DIURU_001562 [Diutina rugosa]KAA8905134.1 hypothetical protein DIURU_001562 [Diutina rugosa]